MKKNIYPILQIGQVSSDKMCLLMGFSLLELKEEREEEEKSFHLPPRSLSLSLFSYNLKSPSLKTERRRKKKKELLFEKGEESCCYRPTDPLTISDPHNPLFDDFEVHKACRSPDFVALKLRKGMSSAAIAFLVLSLFGKWKHGKL